MVGASPILESRHSTVVSSGEALAIHSTVVTAFQNGGPAGGRARAHSSMAAEVPSLLPASLSLERSSDPKGSILLLRGMGA
jgi:hypothetical protein